MASFGLFCVSVDSSRVKLNARELFKSLCIVTATFISKMRLCVIRGKLSTYLCY